MPAQDRVRGDQAMAAQCSGQPPNEGGEHGPVRPVQAWSRIGAAKHGDLVPQHEELDVLGGGRADQQQDQSEHVPEDQVQEPQRHCGDHAGLLAVINHRWSAACATFWNPTGPRSIPCSSAINYASQTATANRRTCWCTVGQWLHEMLGNGSVTARQPD
jgi:hypothetical protein